MEAESRPAIRYRHSGRIVPARLTLRRQRKKKRKRKPTRSSWRSSQLDEATVVGFCNSCHCVPGELLLSFDQAIQFWKMGGVVSVELAGGRGKHISSKDGRVCFPAVSVLQKAEHTANSKLSSITFPLHARIRISGL